jgi:hypothetical protein
LPPEQIAGLIRDNASAWETILSTAGLEELRARPRPDRWSTIEYAAHVRDVFRLYLYRLELMLTEDGPSFPNWDQDETAVAESYRSQDPALVNVELAAAAQALATRFDTVVGEQWTRTGHRSDGAAFTVASFARYLIHDPVHHLWDVGAGTGTR